jgi:hypothetical protein
VTTEGQGIVGGKGKGFSLIELTIFIVVAGIFVPLAYVAFGSVLRESTTPEAIITSRFIAEQKMEELTKDKFASITCPQNTSYAAVTGYSGFQWKWAVGYVTCNTATNTTCAGITNPTIVDASGATQYKKIIVYVKEPKGFEYVASTIVSKRPADP